MDDLASHIISETTARSHSVCLCAAAEPTTTVIDVDEGTIAFRQRRLRRDPTVRAYHLEETAFTRDSSGTDSVDRPYTKLATFQTAMVGLRCLVGGLPTSLPRTVSLRVDDVVILEFVSLARAVQAMDDIVM